MPDKIEKSMFRDYDIRGRENKTELNEDTMFLIGRSFGTFLSKRSIKDVVIGHDMRQTSKTFYDAVIKGLLLSGCNVYKIGPSITPMLYWAQYYFKTKGGVMITASHNPSGWNGVKLSADYSRTLEKKDIEEVYKEVIEKKFIEESV